jgi:hypothetical protein
VGNECPRPFIIGGISCARVRAIAATTKGISALWLENHEREQNR